MFKDLCNVVISLIKIVIFYHSQHKRVVKTTTTPCLRHWRGIPTAIGRSTVSAANPAQPVDVLRVGFLLMLTLVVQPMA
jgi:hypothetical protein